MENEHSFVNALVASGADSQVPPKDQIFSPFLGSWDLTVSWFDEEGRLTKEMPGEWHFCWVLEGRAIQDVWVVPPRKFRSEQSSLYEYGTSVRFFDPAIKAWRSTWIGPMHGVVRTFIARRSGDEVVLETPEAEVQRLRWSFSDISANTFNWRNEIWEDSQWRCQQKFVCKRR